MNFTPVEAIADAVLFEGYILYPYRPSSLKNRQRWNFGTLYPRSFAEAQTPPERWQFTAQVLLEAEENAKLSARVRFLQLTAGIDEQSAGWEQGFPRSRTFEELSLTELCSGMEQIVDLSALSPDEHSSAPAAFSPQPRRARLALRAQPLHEGLYRLTVSFANESPLPAPASLSRRDVQSVALTSAHLLLGLEHGSFVSLLEPGRELEAAAKSCVQDGVFPVLIGAPEERHRMLCSPIILYDYPEVAPESAGDFFDATEMDEMLALRVLTLTDEEKDEMRRGDPHARSILERTEALSEEQLARVHGAIRGLRRITGDLVVPAADEVDMIHQPFDPFAGPAVESVCVFGVELRVGDRVRLWPQKRADILDMEMEGKIATIEAIEQDLENNLQLAVVLEDDPGRDLGMLRQPGHRFFFHPDEVEPLGMEIA